MEYLVSTDFENIGLIATHCDLRKLNIAIEESKNFDLVPLFCFELVQDILDNWQTENSKYSDLINGCNYEDFNGRLQQNLGFKELWKYYAYSRYMLINQFNDTANGAVRKQNEWSIPTPLKEVNDISNKYRNMGQIAFESVRNYLCEKKEDFPKFDDCNCRRKCGCVGKCNCGKTKQTTGFKFSTVGK